MVYKITIPTYEEYIIFFFKKNYAVQLSWALRVVRPPTDTRNVYNICYRYECTVHFTIYKYPRNDIKLGVRSIII